MPAHVHVFGDGEVKINLVGAFGKPELIWTAGMTNADVRKAMRLVIENNALFLAKWTVIHG